MEEVSTTIRKTGIAPGDFVLQDTLTRKRFDIPNVLMYRKRMMPVVVWGRPYYCSCGAVGHMAKVFPWKNAAQRPSPTAVASGEVPGAEWKGVKEGTKDVLPTPSRRSHSNYSPRSDRSRKSSTNRCLSPQKSSNKTNKNRSNRKLDGGNTALNIVLTQIWRWRECLWYGPLFEEGNVGGRGG